MKKIFRQSDDVLTVIIRSKTANGKIADVGEVVVQTYHYTREQFELAQGKTTMKDFFSHDAAVCMDCPFAVSNGAKLSACYTHKLYQYSGFLSSLRSITQEWDDIPVLTDNLINDIVEMSTGYYVRFGTYGEPSLLPYDLISRICGVAKTWTGYTHQWRKNRALAAYFMASVHTLDEVTHASALGFRSFLASPLEPKELVNCPASAEAGFKSTCSKCGLCSGTMGKGRKSIYILEH
jgi:hypothetical protein